MTRPMTAKQQLVKEIEDFLSRSGMSPTRFGIEAMNDRALVVRLRSGKSNVRLDTADRIRRFIRDWRPERPKRRQLESAA